jgi:hypothetical protein
MQPSAAAAQVAVQEAPPTPSRQPPLAALAGLKMGNVPAAQPLTEGGARPLARHSATSPSAAVCWLCGTVAHMQAYMRHHTRRVEADSRATRAHSKGGRRTHNCA